MSVPNNPELEALQGLIESEGWRLWLEWYEKEWGTAAFAQKVAGAVGDGSMDPAKAVAVLQQTTVALRAVQGLKDYPAHRIAQLKHQRAPAEVNLSRRGPGM